MHFEHLWEERQCRWLEGCAFVVDAGSAYKTIRTIDRRPTPVESVGLPLPLRPSPSPALSLRLPLLPYRQFGPLASAINRQRLF